MIPLWLPWAVLAALVAAVLFVPESPFRKWGPAAVAFAVAAWLTVDHLVVSQEELFDATKDAVGALDGSVGGVTQDRLRVEIEDRLGHDVHLERAEMEDAGGDPHEFTYAWSVYTTDDYEERGGPAMCVSVTEYRVDVTFRALTLGTVASESGACE